jgi:hypothetical protein
MWLINLCDCISFRIGGYDVKVEGLSWSAWGQHSRSSRLTFFLCWAKASTSAYRQNRILLYNRIYFNDLCIYVIGVYWNPRNVLLLFPDYPWPYHGGNPLEWLCLVNRTTVEVEWLVLLARFQDCAPYWLEWLVIKLIKTLIWDRMGQLGESREYWMGRVRVIWCQIRSSKVVAPACVD